MTKHIIAVSILLVILLFVTSFIISIITIRGTFDGEISEIIPKRCKRHATYTNFLQITDNLTERVYRSYQRSIYCNPKFKIQYPQNVTELVDLVKESIAKGYRVKAIGNRHSITDIICTDGVPISLKNINYTEIENENDGGTASFGAGIELSDALIFLEKRNKTLIHVPTYGGITLGGAIATGAHGSSLVHPSSISDQIVRLQIIDGMGNLREISDPQDVNAFRVNLGLLGIIVKITLAIVPLFKATVQTTLEPESILMDGTAQRWANNLDWMQMWWFPSTSNVVVLKGHYHIKLTGSKSDDYLGNATSQFIPELDPVIITTGHDAYETLEANKNRPGLYALERFTELSLHSEVIGKPPIFSEDGVNIKNPANGIAWRLMSNRCHTYCPWNNGNTSSILPEEFSVALQILNLPSAIKTIKEILEIIPTAFTMVGIFIRFSKPSDSLMAISNGHETVTLEWASPMRDNPYEDAKGGLGAYQAILQSLIKNYKGRPHWGKNGLYYFRQSILEETTSNLDKFKSYMKKFDPDGTFMNNFGKRITGSSNEMNIDPLVHHCALQEYCICSKNEDCGHFQSCNKVKGFSVCRDLADVYSDSNYDPTNLTSILYAIGAILQVED